jgi:predicted dehydrogenase
VIWQTGSWQRSVEQFRRAVELVRNGRIGKVDYVEVGLPDGSRRGPDPRPRTAPSNLHYDMWLGPAPWRPFMSFDNDANGTVHWNWRWITDYSGGQLTDWAGHHVDIAHWGLDMDHEGPVVIENGKAEYPTEGIYDVPYSYEFDCTYANGVKIKVANRSRLPHGQGVCWYGEKGWIFVSRGSLQASDRNILNEQIGPDEIQVYKSYDHFRNFIDCVKTRKETITPSETAHRSISVGLLGEIAMNTGRKLNWDPANERFIGDDEANRFLKRSFRSPWHL